MARGDTGVQPGSTAMLVLAVLKDQELYGYRIIEELARRSQNVFQLKEGTLYPLLHAMEKEKLLKGREARAPTAAPGATTASPGRGSGFWRRRRPPGIPTPAP